MAETHYQLGVALGFHMKYEEAVVSLEAAISVLETRIKNLKEKSESPDLAKQSDAFYTREKEIAEIEALIPEIKEKITDTNEMKEESIKKVAEMKEQIGFGSSATIAATTILYLNFLFRLIQWSRFHFWSKADLHNFY